MPKTEKTYHKNIRVVNKYAVRPRICAKCALELEMTPEADRESKMVYPRRHGSKLCEKHALR